MFAWLLIKGMLNVSGVSHEDRINHNGNSWTTWSSKVYSNDCGDQLDIRKSCVVVTNSISDCITQGLKKTYMRLNNPCFSKNRTGYPTHLEFTKTKLDRLFFMKERKSHKVFNDSVDLISKLSTYYLFTKWRTWATIRHFSKGSYIYLYVFISRL